MTLDPRTLAYDFDEERLGFEEPPVASSPPMTGLERFAVTLVGIGLVAITVQTVGGPTAGTWVGFLLGFGALTIGGVLAFWAAHQDTTPGIKHDGNTFRGLLRRGAAGWIAGIVMTGFYVLLYWWPAMLGYAAGADGANTGLVRVVDPLAHVLSGGPASQWFLYGFLYTLAVLVFGVRMLMKYRGNRYQLIRTGSVMAFQLVFAFALPNVLKLFQQPEFYFSYFWPLKPEYLFPSSIDALTSNGVVGVFMVFWAAVMSIVATPVLTYFFGKRWYCSWVCGCGGLAETLGDPWRQLSDKSTRAWRIERWLIHSVLVAVVVTTGLLWTNSATQGGLFGGASRFASEWYGFLIGSLFSGVVGVGFYPLLGSRVWCRFGCPMAAILGIFQRFFSRFRITTNGGQCMSCGNCSTYCEMGIDVRAYAEKGENIVRASCVGCGVCSAVCPRGVLKLENGTTHEGRYPGSDDPFASAMSALRDGPKIP